MDFLRFSFGINSPPFFGRTLCLLLFGKKKEEGLHTKDMESKRISSPTDLIRTVVVTLYSDNNSICCNLYRTIPNVY